MTHLASVLDHENLLPLLVAVWIFIWCLIGLVWTPRWIVDFPMGHYRYSFVSAGSVAGLSLYNRMLFWWARRASVPFFAALSVMSILASVTVALSGRIEAAAGFMFAACSWIYSAVFYDMQGELFQVWIDQPKNESLHLALERRLVRVLIGGILVFAVFFLYIVSNIDRSQS